ncbi:hypothetical protein [Vibrio genomosp. F10]|uniref:Curlin subunit CsgB n=1 Tax=Vibrio genomosp. F10 TaxID=723171 RepID=A0A1B9QUT7_9VIBR|nr:hypothetical protein [Vibrio genomosp. F10]OCH71202.1 hypothetical protein A6E14_16055 [Vibrio genomosp. F10]
MRLDSMKVVSLAVAATLLFSGAVSAAPDYTTDTFSNLDLDGFSELDVAYNNYAEVSLSNTHNSQVIVTQTQIGFSSNKAKVSMTNASGSEVFLNQIGSGNTGVIEQRNGANEASLTQLGHWHEAYIIQDGDFNKADITQFGMSGNVNLAQSNGGNYTKIVDLRGSDYSINQSGDATFVIENSMRRNISIEQ